MSLDDVRDLYQEMILDHNRSPRNFRKIEPCFGKKEGFNPLCGDRLTVYIDRDGEVVRDIAFQGSGCAISKASASIMTTLLKGKTVNEAQDLFKKFHTLVTEMDGEIDIASLGKMAVFAGIREYPTRIKCASLAWHTMKAALEGAEGDVTTE